jgi:hypothetical protein
MEQSAEFFRKYSDLISEAEQPIVAPSVPAAQTRIDPKVATGAQSVAKKLGAQDSGQMVAKGLDKVTQGKSVTGQLSQAIAPYVEPLEKILANPLLKQKFMMLIKQVQP